MRGEGGHVTDYRDAAINQGMSRTAHKHYKLEEETDNSSLEMSERA